MTAPKLYEKLGFKLVGRYHPDFGMPFGVPRVIHGIYILKYLYDVTTQN
jgi:hypothetical protein